MVFNPHIFPKTNKSVLFISLIQFKRIKNIFYIKNEVNYMVTFIKWSYRYKYFFFEYTI